MGSPGLKLDKEKTAEKDKTIELGPIEENKQNLEPPAEGPRDDGKSLTTPKTSVLNQNKSSFRLTDQEISYINLIRYIESHHPKKTVVDDQGNPKQVNYGICEPLGRLPCGRCC